MRATGWVALWATGCFTPVFSGDPACEVALSEPTSILAYMQEADETKGAFDVSYPTAYIVRSQGSYSALTGDIAWVEQYADDHRIDTVSWEGFGTLYSDATYDLSLTKTTHFRSGETQQVEQRNRMSACNVQRIEHPNGQSAASLLENGTWKDDGYHFDSERLEADVVVEGHGERHVDGSSQWSEAWRAKKVEQHWTYNLAELGGEDDTFEVRDADSLASGTLSVYWEGRTLWQFDATNGASTAQWKLDLDPAGLGRGTVHWHGETCEVTIKPRGCVVESTCDGAPRPPCTTNEATHDGVIRDMPCCP